MPPPQPFNLETYDTLKDLYWWYCKQDAYHSLISTDPLMYVHQLNLFVFPR
jgi:hypothetical protein